MPFRVPLSSPDIEPADIEMVNRVLETPYLSIGPMIEQFEREWARYTGTHFAAGVSSGTAGLHLAVIAAGVGPGDEVITTPFSFVASSNVMLYQQATPIFVDIDAGTMNIDPNRVEDKIKERRALGKRVKAILPVHVFGQPCDMDALCDIASRYELKIIEDACEAMGAEFKGRRVGTFGHAAVFAFYPNKQMTTGEGGVLVTNDESWDRLFRSLRNQGRDDSGTWLRHIRLGYNYRLDEMSAALGLAQVRRLDRLIEKRARVADGYTRRMAHVPGVQTPYLAPETTRMSWFVYVIRFTPAVDRNAVLDALQAEGIPARPYFAPIHLQPFYRDLFGYREGSFPITEGVAQTTLALPFHSKLGDSDMDCVVETLSKVLAARKHSR